MKIVACEQRSADWWECRRGIPTASAFDEILTPKTMKASASQEKFICRLIAEKYANVWPTEGGFVSDAMQYGIDTETRARLSYEFLTDSEVSQVGFCLSDCGRFGCSPDGLIGDEGGLELKCPNLETHAKYLLDGGLPAEYKCQVHGSLIVSGLDWWDFMSHSDDLPPLIVRVEPDDFTKMLKDELQKFLEKLDAAVTKIERIRNGNDRSRGNEATLSEPGSRKTELVGQA